jgi:hypothetical protein
MVLDFESVPNKQGLSVFDPELPFLASEAAIDIENIVEKRPVSENKKAYKELAKKLKEFACSNKNDGDIFEKNDSSTLFVLCEVLTDEKTKITPDAYKKLFIKANDIAESLLNDKLTLKHRDICISLAREIRAYNKSIWEQHPKHPFRRQI